MGEPQVDTLESQITWSESQVYPGKWQILLRESQVVQGKS